MTTLRPLGRAAAALVFTTAALLTACGSSTLVPEPAPGPAAGTPVEVWLTRGDKSRLLAREPALVFGSAAPAGPVIEVDERQRFQTMAGFGASITDASAWLIQQHMSPAQREALLQELFGRGGEGLGFSFTRLTIGASDFSRHHYSLDDRPAGETDMALAHFSIDANRADVLPVVKRALAINPALQVMASPWSAPAWMKTNGSLIQGALRQDMHEVFARYLVRYVDAYAAEGVPIFALTVQNEPHFEPKDYPGMRLESPARADFIGRRLGPLLEQRGLKTQIIEWDHNWNEPQAPLAVLADPLARRYIAGVGWHCYDGTPAAQARVHDAHPDKDTWFTECSGGEFNPRWNEYQVWMARHVLIGSTRAWARGVLMWNLALDEKHGPHKGGCSDCRGVVTIDSASGAVTRNLEYYVLGHASRFVRPGAQRIASTTLPGEIESVAFRNADDGSLVLIALNPSRQERRFTLRHGELGAAYTLAPESLATLVWKPAPAR